MTPLQLAIKKIATGPHLSKDLSVEETRLAMLEILSGEADDVHAAIFFIALRMKRETDEENFGIYQALQQNTKQIESKVDQLLNIADPFNGFNRHCPIMTFLPAVLGASGLPTLSQGVEEMGPKFGVTHSQVLAELGANIHRSTESARDNIDNSEIAWAYLDQAEATPGLFSLQDLRTRMMKRPSLATLEKLLMPIKAKGHNHLQVGFVHKAYPEVLAWLSHQAGFASALLIKGIEGGVLPNLRGESNNHRVLVDQVEDLILNPADFGIEQTTRGVLPTEKNNVTAAETVELGLKALAGQSGAAFDSLVYGAAISLWHCGLFDSQAVAADHVRTVIKQGRAKAYFDLGLN